MRRLSETRLRMSWDDLPLAPFRGPADAPALGLEYLTVGWNVIEGVIAAAAAVAAGSVALLGFGIDSFVGMSFRARSSSGGGSPPSAENPQSPRHVASAAHASEVRTWPSTRRGDCC